MKKRGVDAEIMELFYRVVAKYNALEKLPVRHGTGADLYHSERHMLDRLGSHPDLNVTELARQAGVTKGAISQVIRKLEGKGLVRRYKKAGSDKEVFVALTEEGQGVHRQRARHHAEALAPLSRELARYSGQELAALLSFFRWLERFMDQSREAMESHGKEE